MRLKIILLCTILTQALLNAQPIPGHYTRAQFLFAPSSSFEDGLIGFANPAQLALLQHPEFRFHWTNEGTKVTSFADWGFFSGFGPFGLAAQRQHVNGVGVTDFRISTGWGTKSSAWGLGYGWSSGKFDASGREKLLSLGSVFRPARYLSVGATGNLSLQSSAREGVFEVGVRPLGTSGLTLFADMAIQKRVAIADAPWSIGGALQPVAGIFLTGRYFESKAFTLGFAVNFGNGGSGAQLHFNKSSEHTLNSYHVRAGGLKNSLLEKSVNKNKFYLPLNLKGRVDYLKFKFFNAGTQKFYDILANIRAAVADGRISAIALNLSGLAVGPELAWELREELKKARQANKKVIVFIDNVAMTNYHLASIADKIVLDPQGSIMLKGYALGQTYFRGTLEKFGLGFDEWRFFKYKSANEIFSRDSMSVADREQNQAYVDDLYETTRAEICHGRGFSQSQFDGFIDNEIYFTPEIALQTGLVDTLSRWSEIAEIIKQAAGAQKKIMPADQLYANSLITDAWGGKSKIAVVYGLGVCAMDEGIRARWLEQVFLTLSKNKSVKAVVFRVDSPGGDGMASDVVAEAIKKCKENKPVIISQGQVAASGGYWISMYGDEIIAAPQTITGSIGVIFGWVYDKSFGQKLGMTSDIVKRGEHADIGAGIRIPFTGLQVPARNLTDDERKKAEDIIKTFYAAFVKKVAAGRNISENRVHEIAQGRVYSGIDGKEVQLVDKIGGLITAINVASEKANLKDGAFEIIEIPENKGLFNIREQISPISVATEESSEFQFIKFIIQQNGRPVPVLIPGSYPDFN